MLDELIVPITVQYLGEDGLYKVSCPALQGYHAWGKPSTKRYRQSLAISGP